ncbi:MAG: SagB/ThcOx family dehydrogenase [Candidatus Brocadia sp.]|nr:SagB/ThcOx family dehydrogenase [Candidatus Brocadia sp.]
MSYYKSIKSYMQIYLNIRTLSIAIASFALLANFYVPLSHSKDVKKELSIGERFHHETSLTWLGVIGDLFHRRPKRPPQYKNYPDSKVIILPKPEYRGISLESAIEKRRSVRNYSSKPLTLLQLSQLLFSAQGITGKSYDQPLRTAPSAGALYPFEIYVIANNAEGLPQGIYHYAVLNHSLELVKLGDFRKVITDAGLKQEMLGDAHVTFVLSAIFDRIRHKYGERGFRYVYMEAGHISQNIYLQAVSLGLGSVSVGAFLDEEVNQLIGVDGQNEAVIYLHAVGTL